LLAGGVTLVAGVAGTISSPAVGGAVAAATLALTFTGARAWWGRLVARRRRRVDGLMDALANDVVPPSALPD